MQNILKKLWGTLQFFADGAAAGDGDGTGAAGVGTKGAAADAGQMDALAAMGVPAKELEKYRANRAKFPQTEIPARQDAAAEQEPEQKPEVQAEEKPQTLKDALRANSEWNREAQQMMSDRVRKTNETLNRSLGILGMIAKDYGMEADDLSQLDLEELGKRVENDDRRYRKMAADLGTDTDTAKQIDQQQRENRQLKAEQKRREQQEMLQKHYMNLQKEAEELRKAVPDFDLDRALQDPAFYNETLPGKKTMSVKQIWYGLHGDEIAEKRAGEAAAGSRQAIANAMKAQRNMPGENGSIQRRSAPSQVTPYSKMNPEQRKQFEKEIRAGRRF